MADEIFALSPIAARPVQPSEQDYDAIKEAFMETSRGRWFLGEYAKRNRNADTKMVLDAVARIEDTLAAAQKKPVRDPLLDEALTSFRTALAEARGAAQAAVGDLALEQNLAPVRKGARVIREIAWRLREIGADGRICDLIDQQVAAIEGAAGKLSPSDLASTLSGAFDRIEGKIAAFDADEAEAAAPPAAKPPEAMNGAPAAEARPAEAEVEIRVDEPAANVPAMQASAVASEAETEAKVESKAAVDPAVAVETAMAVAEAVSTSHDGFDANDEAVLDMVAMEMAAFDTDEAYEPKLEDAEVYERQIQESQTQGSQISAGHVQASQVRGDQVREHQADTPQADKMPVSVPSWEIDVTFASDTGHAAEAPVVATALPAVTPLQPEPEPLQSEPEPPPAPAPSLGSSLLANGIVPRPRSTAPDPLAPIRRMSQNEKIAFFS
jgi:hypothetical protein